MKTPLIERMEKKGAPKTWITEVRTLMNEIESLNETKQEYLDVIDALARENEALREDNDDNYTN